MPVIFPPGRDMLETSPRRTGSPVVATIGMVVVESLAATDATEPYVTMRSTLSWTSSAASVAASSALPSAPRASMIRFWPSIQPVLAQTRRQELNRRGCRSAGQHADTTNLHLLLCGAGERRIEQAARECCDKRPPIHHLITLSARSSRDCGIVKPSASSLAITE